LCELTGLAKSTVSEHVADLMEAGIVKTRINDLGVFYELEQPEQIRLLLRNQNPSLLKKASGRFIDLWTSKAAVHFACRRIAGDAYA